VTYSAGASLKLADLPPVGSQDPFPIRADVLRTWTLGIHGWIVDLIPVGWCEDQG